MPFLGQLRYEGIIYLKRKPITHCLKKVLKGSTQVLVEVILVQLRRRGHALGIATPNFYPESESSILGISNEVSFVSRFFCKKG